MRPPTPGDSVSPSAQRRRQAARRAVLSIADDRGRTLAADGTWDAEGKATVTTGEDGRVTVSGVDSGKLEVRELKAPKGYTAFEGTRTVTVKAEGLDVNQVAAAKPKLTITAESPLRADSADAGRRAAWRRRSSTRPSKEHVEALCPRREIWQCTPRPPQRSPEPRSSWSRSWSSGEVAAIKSSWPPPLAQGVVPP